MSSADRTRPQRQMSASAGADEQTYRAAPALAYVGQAVERSVSHTTWASSDSTSSPSVSPKRVDRNGRGVRRGRRSSRDDGLGREPRRELAVPTPEPEQAPVVTIAALLPPHAARDQGQKDFGSLCQRLRKALLHLLGR